MCSSDLTHCDELVVGKNGVDSVYTAPAPARTGFTAVEWGGSDL